MSGSVRAFAPATVGNVIAGFDVMGLALQHPGDEVVARKKDDPGVAISKITGDKGRLPLNPDQNTAGIAVKALLRKLAPDTGIELEIHKRMPVSSGMGSSAASAVAAVMAVNTLLGSPLSKQQLLPFAIEGERASSGFPHADNVAPALHGGITLILSYNPLEIIGLPFPEQLLAVVIHPDITLNTRDARQVLPENISLKQATAQMGCLGGLVTGLLGRNFDIIKKSLRDYLAEPYRSKLIPGYDVIKQNILEAGALGCGISGAGPSIFALCKDAPTAEKTARTAIYEFNRRNIQAQQYISPVNTTGAKILD